MKRRFAASICCALLVWAALDDVLAAQTPEPDDDLAAALDNDYVQYTPVKVPSRETSLPLTPHNDIRLRLTAAVSPLVEHSFSLADPLYLLMSLQR